MYRTYSYNNMPEPIRHYKEEKPVKEPVPAPKPEPEKEEKKVCRTDGCKDKDGFLPGILDNFEADDFILIIVIFALLADDCDDKLLILALAFIFFSELF